MPYSGNSVSLETYLSKKELLAQIDMKHTPIKTIYYTDERNDEFSSAVITPKRIDESWDYAPSGRAWKWKHFFAYRIIATPLAWLYTKMSLFLSVRNRRVLKHAKGTGFFVYGNHTQETADAFIPTLALFPREVSVIVHPNNVSMPVLGRITPYLGALPLPSNTKAMRNFLDAVKLRISEKHAVMIYPEAHIWPYYTGIRNFPATSMKYPAELGVPAFAMTTTYRRLPFRARPRAVTYLDGPFYPDMSLSPRQRATKLRDEIYNAMLTRTCENTCEYIRYCKKEMCE